MSFWSSKKRTIRNKCLTLYGASLHEVLLRRYVRKISQKRPVKVVFFATNVSMWRYQWVYEHMKNDSRFTVDIVLSPSIQYARAQQEDDLRQMREFFAKQGVDFVDWKLEQGEDAVDIRKTIDPDILFYAQQYDGILTPKHEYRNFLDRLLCLVPYGIGPSFTYWFYDTPFHNLAWRLYYPSPIEMEDARLLAFNKARNARMSGYSIYDDYRAPLTEDPWKQSDGERKRIIWAPHFTLPTSVAHYHRANFLWMADVMVQLARKYEDRFQFAFKPHPKLLTELYKNRDWGKEKTDAYYKLWQTMPNTQLETGAFAPLFKTSDALIHDSNSFSVEYMFVNKPALYITQDMEALRDSVPKLGKHAFDAHYVAADEKEIENFLLDVVAGGNDPLEPVRRNFYDQFLKPPHNEGVGEYIYHDICNSLFS